MPWSWSGPSPSGARGLPGDTATVPETPGRVVNKVVLKVDGGALQIALPRQAFTGDCLPG